MAGEISKLLVEYSKRVTQINASFALGKPNEKSLIYTAPDKIDPLKLTQNPNPSVMAKAAMLQNFMLPMETTDQITEFIYKLNVEADQLSKLLTNITLDYTVEYLELLKELAATMDSIIRNLLSLTSMILYFTLLMILQIVYHILVDVFQTILNLTLMVLWMIYAFLFMVPDKEAGVDQRAPENAMFLLSVLIPYQILILVLYLSYITTEISLYIVNYILSILFLVIHSVATILRRTAEIVIIFERSLEQVTGVAGMIPLILSIEASKTTGTTVLASQLINPLPT